MVGATPLKNMKVSWDDDYSQYPPTPALAKAGAAPGTTAGVELVFLSNNPKARSIVSSQRGPRQQAPQGHNNGFLGFLWASKPAVCQPLNP